MEYSNNIKYSGKKMGRTAIAVASGIILTLGIVMTYHEEISKGLKKAETAFYNSAVSPLENIARECYDRFLWIENYK